MPGFERRLSALERTQPMGRDWPWLRFIWQAGEPEPVVPPNHHAVIWRIVEPGDPSAGEKRAHRHEPA